MYDHLLSDILPHDKHARILDLGCGAGLLLEWLSQRRGYSNAMGIDKDLGQISFAKNLGLHAEVAADTSEWLSEQAAFELVIMTDVLSTFQSLGRSPY